MACAVYHEVPKLQAIVYNNGLRQEDTAMLLASSLTNVNGNFSIPSVSVKEDLWFVVSTLIF